jgi:formate dehydrogenase subunit delta
MSDHSWSKTLTGSNTVNREIRHLLSMANDIAVNLKFHTDADERIADHINRFWAPRMRGLLLEYASGGGQGLAEALLPALDKLRK